MDLPSNPDILHRILEFLGPRSTCLTIGSTNHTLRQLSQCDSLWRIFWMRRCCLTDDRKYYNYIDERSISGFGNNTDGLVVHRAALTFRHAIHSLNLTSKLLFAATHPPPSQQQQQQLQEEGDDEIDNDNDDTTTTTAAASPSLYTGYIQTHSMMKLTNLRPVKLITNGDDGHDGEGEVQQQHYQLRQQSCTQTWPGQLSLLNERLLQQPPHAAANNTNNNHAVTCLNSAEIWCDHPTCNQARCGPQGCLRCYRFLPPPPVQYLHQQQQQQQRQQQRRDNNRLTGDLDGPGDILGSWRRYRECTDRNYDLISFVKCDWCSVSLCNDHIDTVYNDGSTTNTNNEERRRRRRGGEEAVGGGQRQQQAVVWYKCDECNLSSCPQCISQVFPIQPPQMCHVITAGKKCGRQICSSCIWAVGKEGPMNDNYNIIPGGKISYNDDLEVVSIRARDEDGRRKMERFQEKEMCCSKCLRHVEFRWRELSVVLNMFDGFVP